MDSLVSKNSYTIRAYCNLKVQKKCGVSRHRTDLGKETVLRLRLYAITSHSFFL